MPDWAADIGVGSPPSLLVDIASIAPGEGDPFERCNWLCAAYLFLSGAQDPPGHTLSYSAAIQGADARLYDHAWVNRIFLLLRRMASLKMGVVEQELFGPLPAPSIRLTHDVDAIQKTAEIRFKQTAFHLFNAARAVVRGRRSNAKQKLQSAARFLITSPSYNNFAEIRRVESERGIRSTFHFYGGLPGLRRASLRRILLDPAYDVSGKELKREMMTLLAGGWSIGVHLSYDSWNNVELIRKERDAVAAACGVPVTACRQHWLRFSWTETWRAQEAAGLRLDTTLGFNDRPGFRCGAAVVFRPWMESTQRPLELEAIPMVLMDSHFYDYRILTDEERRAAIFRWIAEVRAVAGEASVNWHVHTLAPDYGWDIGYRDLLDAMA